MELLNFIMTGTKHSAAYNLHRDDITAGDLLDLEWDEHNQYDTEAIKVLWQGQHIGWVPKKLGEAKTLLRKLMQMDGLLLEASVADHEPDNPVDMQLSVVIRAETGV